MVAPADPASDQKRNVKHAMRAAGKKARAVDGVGASFDQRLQQHRVLCRIVLEIGVLDDDEVPVASRMPRCKAAPSPMFLG